MIVQWTGSPGSGTKSSGMRSTDKVIAALVTLVIVAVIVMVGFLAVTTYLSYADDSHTEYCITIDHI